MQPVVTPVALDYLAQTLEEKGFVPEVLDLALADDPQKEARSIFRRWGVSSDCHHCSEH